MNGLGSYKAFQVEWDRLAAIYNVSSHLPIDGEDLKILTFDQANFHSQQHSAAPPPPPAS